MRYITNYIIIFYKFLLLWTKTWASLMNPWWSSTTFFTLLFSCSESSSFKVIQEMLLISALWFLDVHFALLEVTFDDTLRLKTPFGSWKLWTILVLFDFHMWHPSSNNSAKYCILHSQSLGRPQRLPDSFPIKLNFVTDFVRTISTLLTFGTWTWKCKNIFQILELKMCFVMKLFTNRYCFFIVDVEKYLGKILRCFVCFFHLNFKFCFICLECLQHVSLFVIHLFKNRV